MPSTAEKLEVWRRDGYECRYCGLPVIPREVLEAFSLMVGPDHFPMGRANRDQHGLALLTWAQHDHVVPFSRGGSSDPSNIVTACSACNYGKGQWTVEELGIEDPRTREPAPGDWDGLHALLVTLEGQAPSIARNRAT